MTLAPYLPFWEKLTPEQRQLLEATTTEQFFPKGSILHHGASDCVGPFLVISGRLRTYFLSDTGKEVTLYRLFERDMCLLSAACILHSIEFEVTVVAEQDTKLLHLSTNVYQQLMQQSAAVANYTSEVMATRFSDVMWLLDQVLYKKMDTRIAAFLLEESTLENSDRLSITHEEIARHLGSAREVVSRMLKYFEAEGLVLLSRGAVQITDKARLRAITLS